MDEVVDNLGDVAGQDVMSLKVISPEGVIFEGEAKALELLNELGPFSVFPYHETFITIIKSNIKIFDKNEHQKEIPIENGIIRIYLNKVEVFLGLNYASLTP